MAFTDEQFDQRLSPMFRSMKPDRPRSPLNGLLSNTAPSQPPPQMSSATAAAYENRPVQSTPSRNQLLTPPGEQMSGMADAMVSRRARTQYARTPPPATSPQQVWRTPTAEGMTFPPITVPPSVTAGLLDDPNAVAAGLDATPMTMPPAPPLVPDSVDSPPPPEMEVVMAQQPQYSDRPPEYLAPLPYVPLQPSRRYEVI